jgi:hypothetical protein
VHGVLKKFGVSRQHNSCAEHAAKISIRFLTFSTTHAYHIGINRVSIPIFRITGNKKPCNEQGFLE